MRGKELMTNVQAVTTPRKPAAKQRMYRGILTAQAICDVFVRTTSDVQANRLFEAGKGQRKKPRFGEWQLWQEAIAVDTYAASEIPAHEVPKPGLREQELQQIYRTALHKISTVAFDGAGLRLRSTSCPDHVGMFGLVPITIGRLCRHTLRSFNPSQRLQQSAVPDRSVIVHVVLRCSSQPETNI
jgi:hypothetical protein